jgi:dipeptidyl aminopeptidase/acylaminoacyl peptidase
VLRPNARGSTDYGNEFRLASIIDWGGGDYRDLMMGVDKDKLGVPGWRYGGLTTSWIITQKDRFKAAIIGTAVTNLISFNGTTDIPNVVPSYFSEQSWEVPEAYAVADSTQRSRFACGDFA